MMSGSSLAVILAAGEGKRMKSKIPKVLHSIAGLPMLAHVMQEASAAGVDRQAVVVGTQAQLVTDTVNMVNGCATIHVQSQRLGTAHAVLAARDAITPDVSEVLVLYGDVPLITTNTISQARNVLANGADIVVLGFETSEPFGYGRMVMQDGDLTAIREEKDASDEEKKITFCNSGIICFRESCALDVLDAVGNQNSQNEYYLTDVVEIGRQKGLNVASLEVDEEETLGVNDRVQLADVEQRWQRRRRNEMLKSGVSMQAPHTVFFSHDTEISPDVTIEPNVVFASDVIVAKGATIRSFSHLEGALVGVGSVVGPYARLRPGTRLGEGAKIGNFVETKAAQVGKGAKINHLSYVGDSLVGAKANIGAGTITCNYDGFGKHQTIIGEDAFIGSNTALVAPVRVGDRANTAAGSVIYKDIEDDALAIERSPQVNKDGMAKILRDRNLAKKRKS